MSELFSRNELYWGEDFQKFLSGKCVAIFGAGGVGGYAIEGLARAGVGKIILVDFDEISESNINRQLIALHSNIGKKKVFEFEKRLKDINPDIKIKIIDDFYDEEMNYGIFSSDNNFKPDYVIDAIDSLRSKISLITYCVQQNIPLVSSLGAGNRVDGSQIYSERIEDFKPNCQFGRNVIARLKKNNVLRNFIVVSSKEKPHNLKKIENIENIEKKNGEKIEFKKITPASTPIVVAVAGYYLANETLKSFLNDFNNL